jgi:hypothetical protein
MVWTYAQPVLEHWLSSGFLGVLGYWSTWIICRSWWHGGFRSRPKTYYVTPEDHSMDRLCFAAGLTCSIAAHLCIDYVVGHGWLG